MTRPLLPAFLASLALTTSATAAAPDPNSLIDAATIGQLDTLIDREIVKLSVRSQNDKYGDLSQEEINQLDQQWRKERKADDKPLISATLSSPLSIYLSRFQGRSTGLFVEIFVMDNKGLNVGQSSITSDFWQGDEDKFIKTFNEGAGAVFIDKPEWDADLKIWRSQISKPITESDGKTLIGAITMEINLTELERRQLAGATN